MNKTRLKNFAADVLTVLLALGVALIISVFVRPTIVNGASMENTLHDGDYLIVARQAYLNHSPERGDIVIIQSSLEYEKSDKGKLIIKRIIGLPGDKIEIIDSKLFVNNQQLQEEYIEGDVTPIGKIPPEGESIIIPEGYYYVLGDNRCNSRDSRDDKIGLVSNDDIKGKAIIRLFPFSDIRSF